MYLDVGGQRTYCYTGGRPFAAARPTVVFIHGVLNDHSVWGLQTRYFAHHGWNVLAPDLPGQCRSGGDPPASVEAAAHFAAGLLDAAGVQRAAFVGHSFGSLIALELAGSQPGRVSQLALAGTALPITVTPSLLELSRTAPLLAIEQVNAFSHSTLAPPPSALGPGTWLYGASRALMQRVQQSNPASNLLHTGFAACNGYGGGEAALRRVACEVLFILGKGDRMTPPRAAQPAIEAVARSRVATVNAGHQMMVEAPDEVLAALAGYLRPELSAPDLLLKA